MNLVIDDAVEVRQATKTEEEKRRPLGMHTTVRGLQIADCSLQITALTATATAVIN
jgi:small nuclear ribonucleoprotein (snRNP)-like protein